MITVFSDGACQNNPGPGGWGVLICYSDGREEKFSGAEQDTTNNRMELTAAIEGLLQLPANSKVTLVTDSTYVQKGITEWLPNWEKKQWRTATGSAVKNKDLWQEFAKCYRAHEVTVQWVKGHSGHSENELVDKLAKQAIQQLLEE